MRARTHHARAHTHIHPFSRGARCDGSAFPRPPRAPPLILGARYRWGYSARDAARAAAAVDGALVARALGESGYADGSADGSADGALGGPRGGGAAARRRAHADADAGLTLDADNDAESARRDDDASLSAARGALVASRDARAASARWAAGAIERVALIQAALGGALFLDEAYALSGGGKDGDRGDSFSDEALRTLLTETENNRNSLCVVLAGYRDGMAHLMRADPGTPATESNR